MMTKQSRTMFVIALIVIVSAALLMLARANVMADEVDSDTYVPPTPTPINTTVPTQTPNPLPTPTGYPPSMYPQVVLPNVMLDALSWIPNDPPSVPTNPSPLDGTINVPITHILTWESSDPNGDVVFFDVYLDSETNPPQNLLAKGLTEPYYVFQGWGDTVYGWQVVARDWRGAEAIGPVWVYKTDQCGLEVQLDTPRVIDRYAVFSGSTTSPCSEITRISWQWGDITGSYSTTEFLAAHEYAIDGTYTVTATAYNDSGIYASDSISFYVGTPAGLCPQVTDIPQTECEALAALYDATNGPFWALEPERHWFVFPEVCADPYWTETGWEDITCEDGHVVSLYLSFNNMHGVIPPEIADLPYLRSLNLRYNEITALPARIGELDMLAYLHMDNTALTELPPEIGDCASLQSVSLRGIGLDSLPAEFWNLTTLGSLDLSHNNLITLPAELGNLTTLGSFDSSHNNLITLPVELGNLTALTNLYIQNNALTSLPDAIGNLTDTYKLDASGNNLVQLPDSIGNLESIGWLYLHDNNLTSLPDSFGNFTRLRYLSLERNALTALPDSIENLDRINTLSVSENALTTLPSTIGGMAELSTIDVSTNTLTVLPPEMADLTYLRRLYVGGNPTLSGQLPELLTSFIYMDSFYFNDTNWCVPVSGPVKDWLDTVPDVRDSGLICPEASAIQMCRVDA